MELGDYSGAVADIETWKKLASDEEIAKFKVFLRSVPLYALLRTKLKNDKVRTSRLGRQQLAVGVRVCRHEMQQGNYATSLNYYGQILPCFEPHPSYLQRRNLLIQNVCIPLLAGKVNGRDETTFDQVLAMLERQLAVRALPLPEQRLPLQKIAIEREHSLCIVCLIDTSVRRVVLVKEQCPKYQTPNHRDRHS